MINKRIPLLLVAALFMAAVVGCSNDKPLSPQMQDEAAIVNLIAGNPVFQHDVVSHDVPDTTAGTGAQVFWWREYASNQATTDVAFQAADGNVAYPYAVVTMTTTYTGDLHIVSRDAGNNYTHTVKSLEDVFTQTARFEQQGAVSTADRGWVLGAISNIVGGSVPTTLTIDNLALDASISPDQNVAPSDMNTLYPPADRYSLDVDEQVSIILQSGSGANDAWLHDFYGSGVETTDLINQDLGFYSQQVNTPASLTAADAQRVLVLDVLGAGVLDGAAPYEAVIWAVPYVVNVAP